MDHKWSDFCSIVTASAFNCFYVEGPLRRDKRQTQTSPECRSEDFQRSRVEWIFFHPFFHHIVKTCLPARNVSFRVPNPLEERSIGIDSHLRWKPRCNNFGGCGRLLMRLNHVLNSPLSCKCSCLSSPHSKSLV
jgi:hypothetical protein